MRKIPNAPSVLDRINTDEINIKIANLVERLRGPENRTITRAVADRSQKKLARSPRAIAFGGGRRYTPEEAIWTSRTEVETDFLRGYLQGVMRIYSGYFERLGIKLSSGELDEVWTKRIEPHWKDMVQSLKDDLKGDYPGEELSLLRRQMREFERKAGRIFEWAHNDWREKVEEALSAERFGQHHADVNSAGKLARNPDAPTVRPLHIPPGMTWEDLHIRMGEHALQVEVKGQTEDLMFQQAGFEEKRRGKVPDRLWSMLRILAIRGGVLSFDESKLNPKGRLNIKQYVSQLRKRLKVLFPIEGDPFEPTRRTREYRSRFKISSREGLRFRTPGDTTWDKVAIEELRSGCIRFSVDTHQRFGAFSDDEEGAERPEAALRDSCIEDGYDLRSLGLAMADGSPDTRGSALLAVLKAGGKVRRNSKDKAMLLLGKFLCEFMQISEPPFQFSELKSEWYAAFDASSTAGPDPGQFSTAFFARLISLQPHLIETLKYPPSDTSILFNAHATPLLVKSYRY